MNSRWSLDEGRKEDKDWPSDCNGDEYEDEDDDGDGADEKYIKEYDQVETENYFNENDKYCDMNHCEDKLSVDSARFSQILSGKVEE